LADQASTACAERQVHRELGFLNSASRDALGRLSGSSVFRRDGSAVISSAAASPVH
jgi:hypothetical protein